MLYLKNFQKKLIKKINDMKKGKLTEDKVYEWIIKSKWISSKIEGIYLLLIYAKYQKMLWLSHKYIRDITNSQKCFYQIELSYI